MPKYELAKRPGSPRWYIVWSEGRRSRRVSTGTKDREQAELALAALRLESARKPEARPEEVAIAVVLNDYVDGYAVGKPSHQQAVIARKHLLAFYGVATVDKIHQGTHDEYELTRKAHGVGNDTINRERTVLRAALNRAHRKGWLRHVPAVPSLPANPPRERYLTRQEAAKLLRACKSPHMRLFVRLGLYTGARPGAILDLTWDRVDLVNYRITYFRPERVTGNKKRAVVPVGGALLRALRWAQKKASTRNVIEYDGAPVVSVKKAFARAVVSAGLKKVTPGTLRHTAATWAAQSGVDFHQIGGMLGQRLQATTERYAKHHPDFLKDAARAMLRGARQRRAN
jgi:integrase